MRGWAPNGQSVRAKIAVDIKRYASPEGTRIPDGHLGKFPEGV